MKVIGNPRGGEGILKAKILGKEDEDKLEFLGESGCKTKSLPWGEYGYFLELHLSALSTSAILATKMLFVFFVRVFGNEISSCFVYRMH